MDAVHVSTPGLMCDHCTGTVERAVRDIEGVVGVTARHEDGRTSVMFDERVTDKRAIIDAIRRAGFEVQAR